MRGMAEGLVAEFIDVRLGVVSVWVGGNLRRDTKGNKGAEIKDFAERSEKTIRPGGGGVASQNGKRKRCDGICESE